MTRPANAAVLRMSPRLAERFEREALPYRATLLQSAIKLTRNPHDAEDLVQETMTRACAGFTAFKPGTNIRAWLFRIMMNIFINGYRKRQREPLMVYEPDSDALGALAGGHPSLRTESAEEQALSRLPTDQIVGAVRALPADSRQAVYLIDVAGYSYREAATMMGTPIGTVMSRLHRARASLRAQLATARRVADPVHH
jgi:RNA polymerase sigma-70 factor, ECF subfamily